MQGSAVIHYRIAIRRKRPAQDDRRIDSFPVLIKGNHFDIIGCFNHTRIGNHAGLINSPGKNLHQSRFATAISTQQAKSAAGRKHYIQIAEQGSIAI